jgi:dihydrofolate reductase
MKPIVIVAALADNRIIGRDNQLIWRLKSDLRRFKEITVGKPLIMGRKTYDSIGRPLPGRRTIVLTRDETFSVEGVETARSFDAAAALADRIADEMDASEIIVAGGGQVYECALPRADFLKLTLVHASPEGDASFPHFDAAEFRETFREDHPGGPDDEHPFTFVDLARRQRSGFG